MRREREKKKKKAKQRAHHSRRFLLLFDEALHVQKGFLVLGLLQEGTVGPEDGQEESVQDRAHFGGVEITCRRGRKHTTRHAPPTRRSANKEREREKRREKKE